MSLADIAAIGLSALIAPLVAIVGFRALRTDIRDRRPVWIVTDAVATIGGSAGLVLLTNILWNFLRAGGI